MWPEILVYIYMYTDIYLDDIYIYMCDSAYTLNSLHVRLNKGSFFAQQKTEHAQLALM